MLPIHRTVAHPGQILLTEFLLPMGLTQAELARRLRVSQNRINELVRGKRGVTPETALLLSRHFGNSAEFWMNLQTAHDLGQERKRRKPQASLKARIKSASRSGSASAD